MSAEKKILIVECVVLLILILGIVGVVTTNLNLGLFKIIKVENILNAKSSLEEATNSISLAKTQAEEKLTELENAKKEYKIEKNYYDATSNETLNIIKEATLEEAYDIEYMWIKLGNYAKANNLSINIVEPGGGMITTDENTSDEGAKGSDSTVTSSDNTSTPSVTISQNLMINVIGNYLDLAEFVFDVENDAELRFKLDKIKMFYAENNNVTATFEVKNVTVEK